MRSPATFERLALHGLILVTLFWFVLPFAFPPKLFLQDMGPLPDWMIPGEDRELAGCVFAYKDILGRTWYRLMKGAQEEAGMHFQVDAAAFPEGCRITWFSTDANTLRLRLLNDPMDRKLAAGGVGSQYPRILKREDISGQTLRTGLYVGLTDPARESVYVRIAPKRIEQDAWHEESGGTFRDSMWLFVAIGLSILTWALLCRAYAASGKFRHAALALCLTFVLGAVMLDRPFSGFAGQIDAGDDSYYLAYAQNLLVHHTFFKEPTSIGFGARHVARNHGLPGTGLFLSPAVVVQSMLSGEPVGKPIDLDGLRAMRLLSAGYSLAAMILLCASFHQVRPSGWNVIFPSFLLWGTSLSKWTFQRCIFTHSIEMAFLCAILFTLVWIGQKPSGPFWKGGLLGGCLGCAFLVRGEYLLAIPFVPLLLSRAAWKERRFYIKLLAGYGVAVALCAVCYARWVGQISTGYGDIRSSQSQFASSVSSLPEFTSRLGAHMLVLVRDYWASGFVLVAAFLLFTGASAWMARREREGHLLPLNWYGLGMLALVFYISNAVFHTPLGMEWQHRYSLKLYPLALWVLWLGVAHLPDRWRRTGDLGLAVLLTASLYRQMHSFCDRMWLRGAGLFAWTDEQLVLEGMRSPYGLFVAAGVLLFACGAAAVLADAGRRERIWCGGGMIMALLLPAWLAWGPGPQLERSDCGGLRFQYYDDPDLAEPSGAAVIKTLDVWNGHGRPRWNVNPSAYSMAGAGRLYAPVAGEYFFYAESKDGLRMYLDGDIVVDNWQGRSWKKSGRHAAHFLEKGLHPIRIEHCKHSGEGGFRIKWGGAGIAPNTLMGAPYLQRAAGEYSARIPEK